MHTQKDRQEVGYRVKMRVRVCYRVFSSCCFLIDGFFGFLPITLSCVVEEAELMRLQILLVQKSTSSYVQKKSKIKTRGKTCRGFSFRIICELVIPNIKKYSVYIFQCSSRDGRYF